METTFWYQKTLFELTLRFFLLSMYLVCEIIAPFHREIQPEEVWLYKYPQTESYISMHSLWVVAIIIPTSAVVINYFITRNSKDLTEALWCFSLIISLNGAITNAIKVMVGRPRPDYVSRCFADGNYRADAACTGGYHLVNDGRKSFPSGHSSVAFASFGFMSLYLAGKLKVFTAQGKGSAGRLLAVICPVFFSLCVAISRTCDYHHHWQDVTVGSLLGISVCSLCYFNFFPSLSSDKCDIPWKQLNQLRDENVARVKEI